MKKSFIKNVAAGVQLDKQMRAASTDQRFDVATQALHGRESLLESTAPEAEQAAASQVDELIKEGRVSRRYTKLRIDLLDDNPLNSRTFYSDEAIKARMASIAAEGQLTPIMVAPSMVEAGRHTIIDGHYRKRAIHRLGHSEIDVCILSGLSKVDFYRLARTLNAEREQETVMDLAFGFQRLLDTGVASRDDELAEIVGESKSRVSKVLALTKLPKAAIEIIMQNPAIFGLAVAYELALYQKAADADKTVALAERIARDQLTVKKVQELRETAEEGKKPAKAMSRQHKIRGDAGAEIGTLKEWDSGRIVLDIKLDDASKKEAHLSALRAQFGLTD